MQLLSAKTHLQEDKLNGKQVSVVQDRRIINVPVTFVNFNIWEVSCQLRKSQVLRLGLNSVSQNLFEYVSRNPNIAVIEELNTHYILTCYLQDTGNS